jgi:uncharacterized protein (DUF1800 family)
LTSNADIVTLGIVPGEVLLLVRPQLRWPVAVNIAMLAPISPQEWDRAKAAHLLNRAGFGGLPEQIDALTQGGFDAAVRELVDGPATPVAAPPPIWAHPRNLLEVREQVRAAVMAAAPAGDEKAKAAARQKALQGDRKQEYEDIVDLGDWWLERMRTGTDPLEEKLTLFWHGHFATSMQKVKDAYLMWRQNQTFREHARGNFGVLVKAMSRDPAMIQWLDLRESKAQHPNENFAREVMELFTLGEGHYTEKDVTEGARAFTGYRIDPRDEGFLFQPVQHDSTPKQFLGTTISDGDQAIDVILQQPACATFIARKLWTFFAYEEPPAPLVAALAQTLRTHNYELRPVLRQMFTSQEFYSPQAIQNQIKSPVQWIVQSTRQLDVALPPKLPLMGSLKQMGQTPFAPPSVKGWDGGKSWISTSTLLFRYNLAGALVSGNIGAAFKRARGVIAANGKETPAQGQPAMPAEDMPAAAAPPPPAWMGGPVNRPDFQKLAPDALRGDPPALVANLTLRLYSQPLTDVEQKPFVDYLNAAGTKQPDQSKAESAPGIRPVKPSRVTDQHVAELVHLMMSTPRFQLC